MSEQKPLAYAAFESNGNIRIWSQDPGKVESYSIQPLYPSSAITSLMQENERLKAIAHDHFVNKTNVERELAAAEARAQAAEQRLERYRLDMKDENELRILAAEIDAALHRRIQEAGE